MARRLLIRGLVALALAAAAAAGVSTVAACSAGDPSACTITCGAGGACPDGTTCGTDSYCHGSGEAPGSCAQGGSGDDGAGDDGSGADGSGGDGTSDGGGDGADGSDDGGGDGPGACDPCDPVAQCGCADGEGCHVGGDAPEPTCSPAGDLGEEGACATDADCAAGFACHAELGLGGHCQAYCNQDDDCGGGVRLCNRPVAGTDVRTCTSDCDPLDTVACGLEQKCTLSEGADGRWDARCLQHGGAIDFEECIEQWDCAPGYLCVEVDVQFAECEPFCVVGDSCTSGSICSSFLPSVVLGGVEYGYCPF